MPLLKGLRSGLQGIRQLVKAVLPATRWEPHFVVAAILPILLASVLFTLQHSETNVKPTAKSKLFTRAEDAQCRIDPSVQDTCSFVREHCADFDSDGLIPYTQLYYCTPSSARPVLLIGLFVWLIALFAGMAVAASDFLSVHLAVIVSMLDISQNLAGVTIFAFGNGSSDFFSTLAAMKSNSGSLAITELFGAAAFINTVVLGLVAITRPFTVGPNHFVGEVVWFILSAGSLTAFLADGQLVLAECLGIIGLYLAFVCYALLRPKQEADVPVPATAFQPAPDNQSPECRGDPVEREIDENTGLLDTNQHSTDCDREQSVQLIADNGVAVETSIIEVQPRNEQSSVNSSIARPYRNRFLTDLLQRSLIMFPPLTSWNEQSIGERLLTSFSIPLLIVVGLTTPSSAQPLASQTETDTNPAPSLDIAENAHESTTTTSPSTASTTTTKDGPTFHQNLIQTWPMLLPHILGPQFLNLTFIHQTELLPPTLQTYTLTSITLLILTLLFLALTPRTSHPFHLYTSTLAFTTATTWIYLISTTVVTLLKTLGSILHLPPSLLGATIFAIGNSSNDLVANPTVAKRGYPVLAASACLGGPMLNMLLGVGIGGLVQISKGETGIYEFAVTEGLFVGSVTLICALAIVLVYAFVSGWRLDRGLGWGLIGLWCVSTVVNVGVAMGVV